MATVAVPKKPSRKALAKVRTAAGLTTRVLRLRLKDKHAKDLRALASEVNFVWNYVNDLSYKVLRREHRFLSAYDLSAYTSGATKEGLSLHSQTVQAVNDEFVTRRKQCKKAKLRWRVSNPKRSNYSLGWIPFKKSAITYRNGQLHLAGKPLSLWDSYGLGQYELGAGSVSEDARGRWYINLTVQVKKATPTEGKGAIGIDLGLKNIVVTSEGEPVEAPRFYRKEELSLASAQRAGKKRRVAALHAKIRNRRKDFLHKLSRQLVNACGAIFVGNVSASTLAQTPMAKSVLDAGWSMFRTMVSYKSDDAGGWYLEIDEAYSTQTCSACFARSGPRGLEGLEIRGWVCSNCGAVHHRDTNSAQIILARGHARLAGGIPFLSA
ncbi:transposase [Undibacterium sp. 5I1]|uniref:RNA-guided endonuclease InsQ/TnpB family protein n=1 Tax=unclassified Undibacterium TaxID=2630295 RepID=UPI002AB4CBE3|nr:MULTISPECIES: transposase [unclassified Undibacterium]MDY7537874.1 transposase [Undibacterium sp. 5I1]MEB0232998.1 transposase [Undibacterium sp. 10I3]MEB0259766.1 transposase [Undibacterium sp. 5I1]